MRFRSLILGIVLAVGGCTGSKTPEEQPNQLECAQTSLQPGDTWHIKLTLPHALEMAILNPDQRFFFVAFEDPMAGIEPMIEAGAFRRMDRLDLQTADAEAAYRGSGGRKERIFTKPGRYTVLLGEGLRNEQPLIDGRCEVDYTLQSESGTPAPDGR